jgi:hypothetical protein
MLPQSPQVPEVNQVPQGNKNLELLGALLFLIIIIGAGYYFSKNTSSNQLVEIPTKSSSQIAVSGQFGNSPVAVSKVLPTQFPANIPVETGNITENYKVAYTSTGLTQYTVSYTSSKMKAALWSIYNTYLGANKYVLNAKLTNQTKGTLSGTLGNTSLVVVISPSSSGSIVHLTYIVNR